jgi:hypothetical protein
MYITLNTYKLRNSGKKTTLLVHIVIVKRKTKTTPMTNPVMLTVLDGAARKEFSPEQQLVPRKHQ